MQKGKPGRANRQVRRRSGRSRAARKPASTQDVLGASKPARNHVPARFKSFFQRLVQLRDDLLRRQSLQARDAVQEQPAFSSHMADAGTDTYDRDFALSMLSSEQDALYQIEQALDRIRQGTYGKCELTGKPIEPARLEAIPWTRFSADAERQLEREGARPRARLQPREPIPHEAAAEPSEPD